MYNVYIPHFNIRPSPPGRGRVTRHRQNNYNNDIQYTHIICSLYCYINRSAVFFFLIIITVKAAITRGYIWDQKLMDGGVSYPLFIRYR